jgi:hypothetical protein
MPVNDKLTCRGKLVLILVSMIASAGGGTVKEAGGVEGRLEGHAFLTVTEAWGFNEEKISDLRRLIISFYDEERVNQEWEPEMMRLTKLIDDVAVKARPYSDKLAQSQLQLVETVRQGKDAAQIRAQVEKEKQALDEVTAPLTNWHVEASFFQKLPQPLATVTTDSDGRFFVMVPKQTPLIIAALTEAANKTKMWLLRCNFGAS